MARTLVLGASGRLGIALTERFTERGDAVFALGRTFDRLPEAVNYAIFCQRYRGPELIRGEFDASVVLTAGVLKELGFADDGDCSVVIVSSVYGVSPAYGHGPGYHVGKAASIALARYYAKNLGVRTNAVSPWGFTGDDPPIQMREVVDVIEFLCSPKSSGLNGQNIVIDRGLKWAA